MIVYLKFNGIIYKLDILGLDIWTHEASINDSDMKTFILEVLKNNPDILK